MLDYNISIFGIIYEFLVRKFNVHCLLDIKKINKP